MTTGTEELRVRATVEMTWREEMMVKRSLAGERFDRDIATGHIKLGVDKDTVW